MERNESIIKMIQCRELSYKKLIDIRVEIEAEAHAGTLGKKEMDRLIEESEVLEKLLESSLDKIIKKLKLQ